jgi:predicted dehydrogenase
MGVVGAGVMGASHLNDIRQIAEMELAGVCDVNETLVKKAAELNGCKAYTDYKKMISRDNLDAVLIATPHYFHPETTIWAFEQGVHVLCEKPMAVTISDAQRMIDAQAKRPELCFALMLLFRIHPLWMKLKNLITCGEFGRIRRISWTITDWYRTQAYYNSSTWRGTWKGEGGGILMNQCPHQLDLLQWLFGMPKSVFAHVSRGRYHQVEVEDDVNALMEYADGTICTFNTSTGETPGTNRLEMATDRGRVVVENGKIQFDRTVISVSEFTRTCTEVCGRHDVWPKPEAWSIQVPVEGENLKHRGVTQNFAQAILKNAPLIAPGEEGINSLMLANAMLYSGLKNQIVELPLEAKLYDGLLEDLIAGKI